MNLVIAALLTINPIGSLTLNPDNSIGIACNNSTQLVYTQLSPTTAEIICE